jgi:hypothetical protein
MPGIPITNINLKKLFKKDDLIIDNYISRLHHKVTFLLLLIGVIFIFGENYLDGQAIVCSEADGYTQKFCWLHGTTYVADHLMQRIAKTSGRHFDCSGNIEGTNTNHRLFAYYIWLPFLLLVAMLFSKFPRTLWKELLEGGVLKSIMIRSRSEGDLDASRSAEVYIKLKTNRGLMYYTIKLISIEVGYIVGALLSMVIFDHALGGNFMRYGMDTTEYLQQSESKLSNPMCRVFPTVVSCNVQKVGTNNEIEEYNTVCLLSNNLFNMYYFLVLWFWYVILLTISFVGLAYRILIQMAIPAFSTKSPIYNPVWFEIPVQVLLQENMDSLEFNSFCKELEIQQSSLKHRKLSGERETCLNGTPEV